MDNPVQDDEAFTYDVVGNRLTAEGMTGNWSYNTNNELTGYDDVSYIYDDNGNMTQKTVAGVVSKFFYNIEDRLAEVKDGSDNLIASYYYDPFGRRLWKEVSGVRTYFHYADEGLVGEYDSIGNEIKSYAYKPGSIWTTDPLFMKIGPDYYFYHSDYLDTPQKMTAVNGAVVWAAKYSSFGEATVDAASTVTNPLRFPGQYYDAETRLHFNHFRYYDPSNGRYLTPDPIGLAGGLNLFAYTENNPVNATDPYGLDAIPIVFPDYLISTPVGRVGGLGHAGILLIDPNTGFTRYYEYGRYNIDNDPCGCGVVRNRRIPNVVMGDNGRPTPQSLRRVLSEISRQAGHGGRISGAYVRNDNFDAMNRYSLDRMAQNRNPDREPYSITSNNCANFMQDVLEAGGADTPWMVDPRPNSYINELRDDYPPINYP